MKIVADCDIPYLKGVLEPFAEVVYRKGTEFTPKDAADADALIIRTRTMCGRDLLEGSRVRFIGTATIGFDHIDLDYCRACGIEVATSAGCNARGVLQWFGAAMAETARREGWTPREKTLGVVGVGHVGSLIAEYACRWGFRVLCCDPPRQREWLAQGSRRPMTGEDTALRGNSTASESALPCDTTTIARPHTGPLSPEQFVPMEEIAAKADIISFHVPLIREGKDATFHLAGTDFFGRVRPDALVMNASRGEVMDGTALLAASRNHPGLRWIIDTWEHEPGIDPGLLSGALLATPHIAGYSAQGKANAIRMTVQALSCRFGLPLAQWTPQEVSPVAPRLIGWDALSATIDRYYDIAAESAALKSAPGEFERMRSGYKYREEYF